MTAEPVARPARIVFFGSGAFGLPTLDTLANLPTVHLVCVIAIVGAIVFAHWLMRARTLEDAISRAPAPMVSAVWAAMAFAIVIAQGTGNAFIYFQF